MAEKLELEKFSGHYFVIHFRVKPSEFMKRNMQAALNLIAATKVCAEGEDADKVGLVLAVKDGQAEVLVGNPSGEIGEITARVN